ncbi:hypothetical protein [Halomicronema hongdechloris]|uniref:hypothetical protein n=1 Tax=Halomicronema hongdechloris TaxID=1209493 RepID=UPI0009BC6A6E|nr:hypothetical protein [Halomicronema hongdechloris]
MAATPEGILAPTATSIARYPGLGLASTAADAQTARGQAEQVIRLMESDLKRPGHDIGEVS